MSPTPLPDPGADRPLLGDEAARWFDGRDDGMLPPWARPTAVRRTWFVLAVALSALAGIAAAVGTVL